MRTKLGGKGNPKILIFILFTCLKVIHLSLMSSRAPNTQQKKKKRSTCHAIHIVRLISRSHLRFIINLFSLYVYCHVYQIDKHIIARSKVTIRVRYVVWNVTGMFMSNIKPLKALERTKFARLEHPERHGCAFLAINTFFVCFSLSYTVK